MSHPVRWLIGLIAAGWTLIMAAAWAIWPVIAQISDPDRPKTYYFPSASMLPTLEVNDRVRPRLIATDELRRGLVIVFNGPGGVRVSRIVAMGGDVIAGRDGHVRVNGRPAARKDVGNGPMVEGIATRLLIERLPGEDHGHRILDGGATEQDVFGPFHVPEGSLFTLGDDRDFAADSRFPSEDGGVGMVKFDAVIGVVDRLLWRHGFRTLGRPIDDLVVP